MNKYYKKALETQHDRRPVFERVIRDYLSKIETPQILEIGCSRNLDENSIYGDGYSSLYWCDFLLKHGKGKLTIVEIDPAALESCKLILSDFIGKIDLEFICDDGLNGYTTQDFDLYYLDGGDQEWQTFEMFKKINLRKGMVLLDDFNYGGKCDRIRSYYPFYELIQVNHIHQMGIFNKIENYGDKSFKIGELELDYYRGWRGNREASNERAPEAALGKWFLNKYLPSTIAEMGAVLPYYVDEINHIVVDPYDNWIGCQKIDGALYDYKNKNVISLSSLEHVGFDEGYERKENNKAIKLLEKIVNEADNYLIEWGIGQHPILDEYVQNSNHLKYKIMVRENFRGIINNWKEDNNKDNFYLPYGSVDMGVDFYGNSLALVVVSNIPEIIN